MSITGEKPRPILSNGLLRQVDAQYGLKVVGEPKDLGGSRNLNLLVANQDEKYVIRVYRSWITEPRLEAMQSARQALNDGGVPSSVVKPTLSGGLWIEHAGQLTEVEEFVAHDDNMDSWERLEQGLPYLGRVHTILNALRLDPEAAQPVIAN